MADGEPGDLEGTLGGTNSGQQGAHVDARAPASMGETLQRRPDDLVEREPPIDVQFRAKRTSA